jgi:hypothetical protein
MVIDEIFDSGIPFHKRIVSVLDYQLHNNPVYMRYAKVFGIENADLNPDEIPLMPIRAFRELEMIVSGKNPEIIFKSSGTGSAMRSRHPVADAALYKKAIEQEFYRHFQQNKYSILAYTPGYSDNPESSLIWMLRHLIENDVSGLSRFLPLNTPLKRSDVDEITGNGRNVLLFGAAFGLLDLIEIGSDSLPPGSAVIETGGMKTHKREISKSELRQRLQDGFEIPGEQIHSEYGMCELLSQCYAIGGEWFTNSHWVHVSVRKEGNPSELCEPGVEGKIGIIDLANVYSCPFILTEDRGVMDENGRFRVLGRWHKNDMRGCNFLIDRD